MDRPDFVEGLDRKTKMHVVGVGRGSWARDRGTGPLHVAMAWGRCMESLHGVIAWSRCMGLLHSRDPIAWTPKALFNGSPPGIPSRMCSLSRRMELGVTSLLHLFLRGFARAHFAVFNELFLLLVSPSPGKSSFLCARHRPGIDPA